MNNCLMCGVGGQGTVLASRVLAQAAMAQGLFARTAETIGMAQRGGSVTSHVRIGEGLLSSLIPLGQADVLIGFEPGETVRALPYLKQGGVVVACRNAITPVMATLGNAPYDGAQMVDYLKANVRHLLLMDARDIEAACGTTRAVNMALLAAAVKTGRLGVTVEQLSDVLKQRLSPALYEMNERALAFGAQAKEEQA